MDMIGRREIMNKISKMKYEEAVNYFVETLTYYALIKSNQNYFLSHIFLEFIKRNLDRFKKLVKNNNKLKSDLSNLFQLNSCIVNDNFVSIIVDETKNDGLMEFLDEEVDFKSYYLNDNIMSFITPEDKKMFEELKGNNRKYVFSITNSITIPEEEQKKVYDKVLSELPQKFIDNLFLFNNVIRENIPNEFERYTEVNKAILQIVLPNPQA